MILSIFYHTFHQARLLIHTSWDFGNASGSQISNPSATYTAGGTFTVTLVVSDSRACRDTSQHTIMVNPLPVALFGYSVSDMLVAFSDSSLNSESYNWNFGDGNTSNEVSPLHEYSASGTYTVCLVVSNQCGSDTFCSQITVVPPTYQKTIGGSGNETNSYCIHTPGGNLLVAGTTTSGGAGGSDIFVMKTDEQMNMIWSKTFGGPADDVLFDRLPSTSGGQFLAPILTTDDGGFYVLGHTFSFGQGSSDLYLLRIDKDGNLLWSKTYGTNLEERGVTINQFPNGDLLLSGDVNGGPFGSRDVYLLRTDADGNTLWSKRMGRNSADQVFHMQITSDGGFIYAGATQGGGLGAFDAHLLKADSDGNIQWSRVYGGFTNDSYEGVKELSAGGYIVTGYTQSFGAGTHDFVLSKVDANGNLLWTKTFGGPGSDVGGHIITTSDGGFAFLGPSLSFGAGNNDILFVKTNSAGTMQWAKAYGGPGTEISRSLEESADGGFHICGNTSSFGAGGFDTYSIRTDADGNSGCNELAVTPTTTSPTLGSLTFSPFINIGGIQGNPATQAGNISFTTNTLCPSFLKTQNTNSEEPVIASTQPAISIYPNPNKGTFNVECTIAESEQGEFQLYDLVGRKQVGYVLQSGENALTISDEKLTGGVYFYRLVSNEKTIQQGKVVVIR